MVCLGRNSENYSGQRHQKHLKAEKSILNHSAMLRKHKT